MVVDKYQDAVSASLPWLTCLMHSFGFLLRFHNFVCEHLLEINEGGRFTLLGEGEDAESKQDEELFQTARL